MIRPIALLCCLLSFLPVPPGWTQPAPPSTAPIVATFADETITVRDFEIAYAHDVGGWEAARADSHADYEQFLSTYLDYRLKVHAARAAGYATHPPLQRQQRAYRLRMVHHRLQTDSVLHPAMRALQDPLPVSAVERAALRGLVEPSHQTRTAEQAFWERASARHGLHIDTLQLARQLGVETLSNRSAASRLPTAERTASERTDDSTSIRIADIAAFWRTRPALHNRPLDEVVGIYLQETLLARLAADRMAQDPAFRRSMHRHRDGLLLFELMQDSVWTPALHDTLAQRTYFAAHRTRYTRDAFLRRPPLSHSDTAALGGPAKRVTYVSAEDAPIEPVSFQDVRPAVVRDYQAHREQQFVEQLRNRYHAQQYPQRLRMAFQGSAPQQKHSPTQ